MYLVKTKKMDNDKLGEWLENLLKGLVSNPDGIEITRTTDAQGVLYKVKVDQNDVGKVIGKAGSIASATRTLLRSAGFLVDERASMKIDAPGSDFTPPQNG